MSRQSVGFAVEMIHLDHKKKVTEARPISPEALTQGELKLVKNYSRTQELCLKLRHNTRSYGQWLMMCFFFIIV